MLEARSRRAALRSLSGLALLGLAPGLGALAGCGAGPAMTVAGGPSTGRARDAPDLLPGDCDLVVRVDLARMRTALGPSAPASLASRAMGGGVEQSRDPALAWALESASVLWLGLHADALEEGDRVLVVEGEVASFDPDTAGFRRVETEQDGVRVFELGKAPPRLGATGGLRGPALPRDLLARVVLVGPRLAVLASPADIDGVMRVLRDGADERRADPAREGLVSLDVRPRALSPALAERYRSIATIVSGVSRLRARAELEAAGLAVSAELSHGVEAAAERTLRFLSTISASLAESRFAKALEGARVERVGLAVHVRFVVPPSALAKLVG
jgi:hypothetical protein